MFVTQLQANQVISDGWTRRIEQPGQVRAHQTIRVNPAIQFQTMRGMGGAFSELGHIALQRLSPALYQQTLQALFSPEGCNLSFCRMPIGASDFATDAYSLNDTAGDFEMAQFSLARDACHLLPFIKDAQQYQPALALHASPWSPPAWMKDNQDFVFGGSLFDDEKYYRAYALYLCKFIEEYAAQGITIERLVVQNEVDSAPKFPGCIMNAAQMTKFVCDYLKPLMVQRGVKAALWAGTFRSVTEMNAYEYAAQADLVAAVEGFAFQYTLSDELHEFTRRYPKIKIMHTESACYKGENSNEFAFNLFFDFLDYVKSGCDSFTYWNTVLCVENKNTWEWPQNSMVSITPEGEVIYNPDFYVMRELSHALPSGSVRVEAFCTTHRVVAFVTPSQEIVTVTANLSAQAQPVTVIVGQAEHTFTLPPYSIQALCCPLA
ncbi:MAG: glycoside hydrolase family 30 protein [Faecalibacterium sp.]